MSPFHMKCSLSSFFIFKEVGGQDGHSLDEVSTSAAKNICFHLTCHLINARLYAYHRRD